MKRFFVATFVTLVLATALWLGFSAGDGSPFQPGVKREKPESERSIVSQLPPTPRSVGGPLKPGEQSRWPGPTRTTSVEEPKPYQPPSGGEMIHEWLTSSPDPEKVADTVLRGFPVLKPEDHLIAVKAVIPLVTSDRYERLGRLLLDPKTSTEARELLYKDVILRPQTVHLPLLLAIIQQRPPHPSAEEARNYLFVRFGQDYGEDWGAWQARVDEALAP